MTHSALGLTILALCALMKEGLAITCYMCNSASSRNGHLCRTLPKNASIFTQDCDLMWQSRRQQTNYTVCRKMTQTIIDAEGNKEERIIRQCGTESPLDCSWKTRPNTLQVVTCHCNTDLCNTAISTFGSLGVMATLLSVCILLMLSAEHVITSVSAL